MSTTLVLVIILLFAFVAGRIQQVATERLGIPTTWLYVAVGVAVGPLGLGLVDADVIDSLQPVLSVLLGLVGFGMGLMLRHEFAERKGIEVGLLHGLIVASLVGAVTYGVWWAWTRPDDLWEPLWPAMTVGSLAAVTDTMLIGRLAERSGAAGPTRTLLGTVSVITDLVAVAVFGLALAEARAQEGVEQFSVTPVEWLMLAVAVGVVCGALFVLFLGRWGNDQRAFFATVAVVTFASGIAAGLGISPLFAGLVAGLATSVFSAQADDVAVALDRLEEPSFVAILVLAGAMWTLPGWMVLAIAAMVALVRVGALSFAGWLAPRLVPDAPRAARFGHALLPQGALAMAIAANFAQLYPADSDARMLVLSVPMFGLLVADAVGAGAVRRVLADAGEIRHRVGVGPSDAAQS